MTVDFYRDNPQKAPTVENYLFTDYYAQLINGQYIHHNFKTYMLNGQQITEKPLFINAFIAEIPDFKEYY